MNAGIERARRITFWTMAAELAFAWIGPVLRAEVEFVEGEIDWSRIALEIVALSVYGWLFIRVVHATVDGRYARRDVVASGVLALVLIVFEAVHQPELSGDMSEALAFGWGMVAVTWAAVAVLGVSTRTSAALMTGAAVVYAVLLFATVPDPGARWAQAGYYLLLLVLLPYSNRVWLWVYRLILQVHEGRQAQARLAVTEERLRFARDLHDLVGHSLSAIAVKSELAVKLVPAAPEQASAEMTAVRGLAKDALREIREAVRGYRAIDLSAELNSVRAVLEAAGIRCTLRMPEQPPSGEPATLLAWVVREGATNTLRHSAATRAGITLRLTGTTAVLEMVNDGVSRQGAGDGGTGLIGLGERLLAAGGSLTAQPTGTGEFILRAVVPVTVHNRVPAEAVAR